MGRRFIKFIFFLVISSGFFTCLARASAIDLKTAKAIDQEIEKNRAEIIKIRRFLHMNPELSNREYETSKLVANKLSVLGLEVKTGIARTGVVGFLQGALPGPTVAIRADMDALPIEEQNNFPYKSLNTGVMHACGHDFHTSIALGTAMVLSSLKDKIRGSIKFIFQPAEEGAPAGEEGGADLMIREGVLHDPPVRAIFALHVWPDLKAGQIGYAPGYALAGSDSFTLTIKGKSAHGARPQEGIDAIVIAAEIIGSLQNIRSRMTDPAEPLVVSVGKIKGGVRSNIIADKVVMEGTVRALSPDIQNRIPELFEDLVMGITQSYGASYDLHYQHQLPPVFNHPEFLKAILPGLINSFGEANIVKVKPQTVSEDFAFYAEKIPAFYFFLGVKSPGQVTAAPLHSANFNPDENAIPAGIRAMCHLVLNALEQQASLKSTMDTRSSN
ncbi:MAG: M20 family metallopeptidase [Acidobacteriota bacterium]|nr:M20 family metallopeptidase [Acidobacteriota bacterium]